MLSASKCVTIWTHCIGLIYLFIISSSLTHLALITCGYDLTQSIYLTVESVLHSISINPFYLQDDLGRRLMRAGLKCIPQ